MGTRNHDDALLIARRIDPRDPRGPLEQALRIGLYDEWHALAVYEAVIRRYGPIRPFSNIVRSEAAHARALAGLMARYGFAPPVNDWAQKVALPDTLEGCCAEGVADEIENVAMYDDFLSYPMPADAVAVFTELKAASGTRHLPAFQRALARVRRTGDLSGTGHGGGCGRRGHGHGHDHEANPPVGADARAPGVTGLPFALGVAGAVGLGLAALGVRRRGKGGGRCSA